MDTAASIPPHPGINYGDHTPLAATQPAGTDSGQQFSPRLDTTPTTPQAIGIVAHALTNQRLAESSPAWALLRADNGPIIAATLGHIFHAGRRSIEGSRLVEEVSDALEQLRTHFELPRTAIAYINDWVKQGYLIRRSPQRSTEETYELSTQAHTALDYVFQLSSPSSSATRSRLATLTDQLTKLANTTDPNSHAVIERLEEEKALIDARIARIKQQGVDVINETAALEHANDILTLVREMPADFSRVRSDVEELATSLRSSILTRDISAASVLENVFRGVDLINDSDAGRSFHGFYELLFDPEASAHLSASLSAVLSRPFMQNMDRHKREELAWLIRNLEGAATEVHDSMTQLARSLRRFVQSREAESSQALLSAITDAQALAAQVGATTKPTKALGIDLELTTRSLQPISRLTLHDPKESFIDDVLAEAPPGNASLEELAARVRESEIDFAELQHNINDVLTQQHTATIGEIITIHPCTQGLASVVGMLKLAFDNAQPLGGTETIEWDSPHGRMRTHVPTWMFTRNPAEKHTPPPASTQG
ncbi:DUF3375 domain-containing protein [Corynebacterium aquilae]|uniref:DUF3375 domain-containing protein n=1 Tax=Corynebacterium aquilae TaxID=203263 RepID=UPI000A01FFDF|nr:DUF3375 domain-containing protein [Corynebacterium aquilae]